MSRAKAKRPAKKAAQIALKLIPAQVERLHKAHDDLQRGSCIVDCVIASLLGKEVQFAEQEALKAARKMLWPASEWMHDRRMDLPPDEEDEEDEE